MKTKIVLFFAAVLLAAVLSAAYGAEGRGVCPKEPAFQKKTCEVYLDARRLLEGRAEIYLLDPETKTALRLYWGEGELILDRSYPDNPFFGRRYFFNRESIFSKPLLPLGALTGNGAAVFEPRGSSEALRLSELEEIHEFLRRARETIPGKNTPL